MGPLRRLGLGRQWRLYAARTFEVMVPVVLALLLLAADWPQFRGPNAAGLSEETNLPVEFGPDKNVVWKTTLPPGNSSPSISGNRIFLTAVENEKLYTIALDRLTGRILWRREAPRPRKQIIERPANGPVSRSEEHTSELQSLRHLVCRLLL